MEINEKVEVVRGIVCKLNVRGSQCSRRISKGYLDMGGKWLAILAPSSAEREIYANS